MDKERRAENITTIILSVIGFAAILTNLFLKGVDYVNLLDAIKDSVGLLITIAVFVLAVRIKKGNETALEVAEAALKRVQAKHDKTLIGPSYNVEDYKPEDVKSSRMKYLFVMTPNYRTKTALVPLDPLAEGILDIRCSKSTLLHMKCTDTSDDAIRGYQEKVHQDVKTFLSKRYEGLFVVLDDESKVKRSAIIVDFDETKMGKKRFSRAVFETVDHIAQFLESEMAKGK